MQTRQAHWTLVLMTKINSRKISLGFYCTAFPGISTKHKLSLAPGDGFFQIATCSEAHQLKVMCMQKTQYNQWGNWPEPTNGKFFFWIITWELWMIQFAVESYPTCVGWRRQIFPFHDIHWLRRSRGRYIGRGQREMEGSERAATKSSQTLQQLLPHLLGSH